MIFGVLNTVIWYWSGFFSRFIVYLRVLWAVVHSRSWCSPYLGRISVKVFWISIHIRWLILSIYCWTSIPDLSTPLPSAPEGSFPGSPDHLLPFSSILPSSCHACPPVLLWLRCACDLFPGVIFGTLPLSFSIFTAILRWKAHFFPTCFWSDLPALWFCSCIWVTWSPFRSKNGPSCVSSPPRIATPTIFLALLASFDDLASSVWSVTHSWTLARSIFYVTYRSIHPNYPVTCCAMSTSATPAFEVFRATISTGSSLSSRFTASPRVCWLFDSLTIVI